MDAETGQGSRRLARRDLFKLTGAGLGAAAVLAAIPATRGVAARATSAAGDVVTRTPGARLGGAVLTAGHWRATEGASNLRALVNTLLGVPVGPDDAGTPGAITAAEGLAGGDSRFLQRDALVRVAGLAPDPQRVAALFDSVALVAGFQPYDPTAFVAWSFVDIAGRPSISPPIAFRVPVDAGGLKLALRTREKAGGDREWPVTLSPGSEPGSLKLRRGVYLVPLRPAASPSYDWTMTAVTRRPSAAGGEQLALAAPGSPAFLLLSVDFGDAA